MANTLYEYYTGKGQKLPSVLERSKIFETQGLGSSSIYQGTAEQNTSLLNKLQAQPKVATPPITGDNLAPNSPIVPNSPNLNLTFPSAKLDSNAPSPVTLTPEQGRLQKEVESLISKNLDSTGRSAFQSKQEIEQGVPELAGVARDLSSQLKISQLEAANIQADPQKLAQGVTSGLAQRQKNEALRQNSIKSLLLFSQLEVAKGNLTTAQDAADRATNLKYDSIEEEIKVAKENLDLILRSPKYTAEEKQQALEQLSKQEAKQEAITIAKNATATIMNILSDPDFQLNAPASVKAQLSKLALKPDLTQADVVGATNLATRYTITPKAPKAGIRDKLVSREELADINKNQGLSLAYGTTQGELMDMGLIPGISTTTTEEDKANIEVLETKIGLIDSLINHRGMLSTVGTSKLTRLDPGAGLLGFQSEFQAGVSQLVSKETIDTLVNLKARGGTLGALSDQERVLLQQAATKIGFWEIKDKNGFGTGKYKTSKKNFRNELREIKRLAKLALARARGSDNGVFSQDELNEIDSIFSPKSETFNPADLF